MENTLWSTIKEKVDAARNFLQYRFDENSKIRSLILLGLGVVLVFVVAILRNTNDQKRTNFMEPRIASPQMEVSPMLSRSPTKTPTPTPTEAPVEKVEVQYIKREKTLDTLQLDPYSGTFRETFHFYKVGTILTGKYEGGELILAVADLQGMGKGVGARKPHRFRFIKKDDTMTFVPRISEGVSHIYIGGKPFLDTNIFEKYALRMAVDNNVSVTILEYPREIVGDSPKKLLKNVYYTDEEDGTLDTGKLYKVFTHAIFGDIYTTRAELNDSIAFSADGVPWAPEKGSEISLGGCQGSECFHTNEFFAFRPDGTFIKFAYTPDFDDKEINWNDKKKNTSNYLFNTVAGCNREALDQTSVVAPSFVSDGDLEVIGQTISGDKIYGLKNENHPLYVDFYERYKAYFLDPSRHEEEKRLIKTFDDFIESRPTFFWRDPFGRIIRFNNDEFIPPHACEPIIYLYPEKTQKVSVALDPIVRLSDSEPVYRNGWNVIADPTGNIVDPLDNRSYPYLFWEGWSLIFPVQSKGYVVKKNDVETFLGETMPKLGLKDKEKADFMKAWLPYFSDSPYYFITFLDKETIDTIAPLTISPKPDTMIRVLMDIKPLESPIVVEPLELENVPERKGFTVVEWGGLKR